MGGRELGARERKTERRPGRTWRAVRAVDAARPQTRQAVVAARLMMTTRTRPAQGSECERVVGEMRRGRGGRSEESARWVEVWTVELSSLSTTTPLVVQYSTSLLCAPTIPTIAHTLSTPPHTISASHNCRTMTRVPLRRLAPRAADWPPLVHLWRSPLLSGCCRCSHNHAWARPAGRSLHAPVSHPSTRRAFFSAQAAPSPVPSASASAAESYELGNVHYEGRGGVDKSYKTALIHYTDAASKGHCQPYSHPPTAPHP